MSSHLGPLTGGLHENNIEAGAKNPVRLAMDSIQVLLSIPVSPWTYEKAPVGGRGLKAPAGYDACMK